MVRNAEVVPPREIVPEIPEELERITLKALAADPDERYQHAAELYEALQPFRIVDGTIYDAKRLAAYLGDELRAEKKSEEARMRACVEASPPPRSETMEPAPT